MKIGNSINFKIKVLSETPHNVNNIFKIRNAFSKPQIPILKSFHSFSYPENPLSNKKTNQKNLKEFLKEFNKLVEKLNKKLNPYNKVLKVEIDQDLKIPIFKIIDVETNEVIRQIPLEEWIKLWKAFEKLQKEELLNYSELKGLFLKTEV